jgi:hypothetical protein
MARKSPAREAGAAFAQLPEGTRSLAQVKDQLQVSYIKAEELAEAGPFVLLSAAPRSRTLGGKTSEEVAFEVVTRDGQVFFYTPQNNATRTRWVEVLKAGPVGPLTLIRGEAKPGLNAPWIFADEKGKPAF